MLAGQVRVPTARAERSAVAGPASRGSVTPPVAGGAKSVDRRWHVYGGRTSFLIIDNRLVDESASVRLLLVVEDRDNEVASAQCCSAPKARERWIGARQQVVSKLRIAGGKLVVDGLGRELLAGAVLAWDGINLDEGNRNAEIHGYFNRRLRREHVGEPGSMLVEQALHGYRRALSET